MLPCSWAPAAMRARIFPLVQDLAHNFGTAATAAAPDGEDARMTALMADIACQSIAS
jgi:hypothetical protein